MFSAALSLKSVAVNFGTQIGFFEVCVPGGRCLPSRSWSILAHNSVNSGFVCQAGSASGNFKRKKREIFGTQIAQIGDRVPLLTNLRRKMSNRRNRRRRVVIYRASSEQDTFKKRLSQKQEKSLLPSRLPSQLPVAVAVAGTMK